MTDALDHERLSVYRKILDFVTIAERLGTQWSARHAVKDHLTRASDSMAINLAEAVALLAATYTVRGSPRSNAFHHEQLDVYQAALGFIRWFDAVAVSRSITAKTFRRIDELATSIVLNIAEGNGRFAVMDHGRFLKIAEIGAIRASAHLDLAAQRAILPPSAIVEGKTLLRRIVEMLIPLARYCQEESLGETQE